MAETKVETQICKVCDADIRNGALFCYSCGRSVAPETNKVGQQSSNFKERKRCGKRKEGKAEKISEDKALEIQ